MPSSAPLLRRLLPLLPVLITTMAHAAPLTRIDLNTGWEFRQSPAQPGATTTAGWHPATVPGDIHLDLLANKLIPEPFARDNESKLQWISDASWQYRTTLRADAALLRRDHVELVFEGLDSEADVSVNGQHLLTAANMFRAFRVDAKAALHTGSNELLITFASPLKTGARIALLDRYHGKTPAPDKSYLRKAAYEYGWDWGPIFVTSGIWKPAHLEAWDDARIDDLYLRQREITPALARIEAELTATASAAGHASVKLEWSLNGQHHETSQTVDVIPGENHLTLPVEIAHPALWYPNGYGAQPLYQWKATLTVAGKEQDTRTAETGLRSVVLRRDYDKFGRSFEFVVNGIPIYAKGADVIPFDSFTSRVTEPQYRHILQSAKDANMNIVRHWGGGLYESDTFYRVADELGIMVWQDFMFGNDWQPGTTSFREEVTREAEYQVTRLRNHPSIILWCGNNETEESLVWPKNAIAKTLDTAGQVRIWQDYLLLFSSVLPRTVERLDSPPPPTGPARPPPTTRTTSPRACTPATATTGMSGTAAFPSPPTRPTTSASSPSTASRASPSCAPSRPSPTRRPHQHLHPRHARAPEERRGQRHHPQLHAQGLRRAKGLPVPALRQPGPAGRGHQNRRRTPPPHQAREHGRHLLAAQRLLARRLLVLDRLLWPLEGAAVLRSPLLRPHPRQPARRGRRPCRLHRLRPDHTHARRAPPPPHGLLRQGPARREAAAHHRPALKHRRPAPRLHRHAAPMAPTSARSWPSPSSPPPASP